MPTILAEWKLLALLFFLPNPTHQQGILAGNLLKMPERLARPVAHSVQPGVPSVVQPSWLKILADNCSDANWFIHPNHTATITSPGYPRHYPPNSQCVFNVQLRNARHRMVISVEDLDVEKNHDWIKLTSGFDQQIVTGSRVPATPFLTNSHQARVTFHSDEDVQGKGFVLRIRLIKRDVSPPPSTTRSVKLHATNKAPVKAAGNEVCGKQEFRPNKNTGSVSSPGFPNSYPNNLTCRWTIIGPENSMFRLQILKDDFASEKHHDILRLSGQQLTRPRQPHHSSSDAESEGAELATISGQLQSDTAIISPFPVLTVEFSSDEFVSESGFQLNYKIIPQTTDTIILNGHSGLIQSPDYPLDYRENLQLTWIIKGFVGGSQLRLIDLQLDSSNGDYLLIGRGRIVNVGVVSVLKGNLRDVLPASAVISIANASEIYLHFVSNFHLERRRGWVISYEPIPDWRPPESSSNLLYDDGLLKLPAIQHVKKENRRLSAQPESHSPIGNLFAVRGAASTFPDFAARLMEINVEPFHPNQDWQEDLHECLSSMFPRILQQQRPPTFQTTIIHSTSDAVMRVVVTSTDSGASGSDILKQLRSTLSMGRVRCNDSLEMYLPELVNDVTETITGQNWLLVSICIVAFFLVIFSVFLLVHCRKRRKVIRKLKIALTPPPSSNFDVVMEPATQKNPLYIQRLDKTMGQWEKRTMEQWDKRTMGRSGVARYFDGEPTLMNYSEMEAKEIASRLCPQLSKKTTLGASGISQNIPSITQYNRELDVILEPIEEDVRSQKSISEKSSEYQQKECENQQKECEYQQRETETGEILEVCDAVTAAFVNEWRNGRPMTVRAVKQKSLFKKQIKKDFFDETQIPNNPSSV